MMINKVFLKAILLTVVFLAGIVAKSNATHLRAGNIFVEFVGGQYKITLEVYIKTKSAGAQALFSNGNSGILDFGDKSSILLSESSGEVQKELSPDGSIALARVVVYHSYGGGGKYIISYTEVNRNEGVLNIDQSVNTPFYIETQLIIDASLTNALPPIMSVPPIDKGCIGVTWTHNPGAFSTNGDRLTFKMVVPNQGKNTTVDGYVNPADYLENGKHALNGTKSGPATMKIDSLDGTITWDAPAVKGEYNIAFLAIAWRRTTSGWKQIGFVRRDMQIIIDDCKDKRPEIIGPDDICVVAGTSISKKFTATDPDNDQLKLNAYSLILEPLLFTKPPVATFDADTSFEASPINATFKWDTKCYHVREEPYQVVIKATENTNLRLATFKSWNIKVVGPPPIWKTVTLKPKKSAVLEWEPYVCNTQAESMQIWRRIDEQPYTLDTCVTGMPNLGYTLINTVSLKGALPVTKYEDKTLQPGAYYCYRLVATYPLLTTGGAQSLVSEEFCVGPIISDAPILTKVSVDTTNTSKGVISVAWQKPNPGDPGDYYKIYRGIGLTGALSPIGNVPVPAVGKETTFIDRNLNTASNIYRYMIVGYNGNISDPPVNSNVVDSSGIASTVRLEPQSQIGKITLNWSASVPWSNSVGWHRIYRGPENSTENQLVLIDSIDASASAFTYVDDGSHGELNSDLTYCYRVETKGTYGKFSSVKDTLINFSQINCAQPGDSIPPCKPPTPVRLEFTDCSAYWADSDCPKPGVGTVSNQLFINKISWSKPTDEKCEKDISYYKLLFATQVGGEFSELKIGKDNDKELIIRDTFYIDTLRTGNGFARCYKLVAYDRSNNVSETSDEFCIDNCPNYQLPNVFTPDNDGLNCNDIFSAYKVMTFDENDPTVKHCPQRPIEELKLLCPRFVQNVYFRVYNRWGNEVYSVKGGSFNNEQSSDQAYKDIYIDWNGTDKAGTKVSEGVYYYVAEVTFITVDPSKSKKTIKGWVQVLY